MQQDINALIEFVLRHAEDIRTCVAQKREENNGHGHTGGGSTGHMRISDPTALEAIRAVEPIEFIHCPYGTVINGRRETKYIRWPEKWVLVEQATKERYYLRHEGCRDERGKTIREVYFRRYLKGDCWEGWHQTCRETNISRGTYYAIKNDIMRFAGQYAHGMGLVLISDLRIMLSLAHR